MELPRVRRKSAVAVQLWMHSPACIWAQLLAWILCPPCCRNSAALVWLSGWEEVAPIDWLRFPFLFLEPPLLFPRSYWPAYRRCREIWTKWRTLHQICEIDLTKKLRARLAMFGLFRMAAYLSKLSHSLGTIFLKCLFFYFATNTFNSGIMWNCFFFILRRKWTNEINYIFFRNNGENSINVFIPNLNWIVQFIYILFHTLLFTLLINILLCIYLFNQSHLYLSDYLYVPLLKPFLRLNIYIFTALCWSISVHKYTTINNSMRMG